MAKIYAAINAIKAALAKDGIPKSQRNEAQRYNFRGIDDIISRLAPLLAEHQVDIFPQASDYKTVEAESKSGGCIFRTVVKVQFKFVHAEDGSSETSEVFGEAMDSGDKGMNKAFSAAYKVMAIQTFCIPTGDASLDTESENHETAGFREPSYQPRSVSRADIPSCVGCGQIQPVMKSKFDAGYYCNPSRGGCGAKFDPSLENAFTGAAVE